MNNKQLDMVLGYLNEGTEIDEISWLVESINETINQFDFVNEDSTDNLGFKNKIVSALKNIITKIKGLISGFFKKIKELINKIFKKNQNMPELKKELNEKKKNDPDFEDIDNYLNNNYVELTNCKDKESGQNIIWHGVLMKDFGSVSEIEKSTYKMSYKELLDSDIDKYFKNSVDQIDRTIDKYDKKVDELTLVVFALKGNGDFPKGYELYDGEDPEEVQGMLNRTKNQLQYAIEIGKILVQDIQKIDKAATNINKIANK
jgi:hypothetical protein